MPGKILSVLVAGLLVSACGVDSSAEVQVGGLAAETELSEQGAELHSNRADVWFPMEEGNRWELVSSSGAKWTVSVDASYGDARWVSGLFDSDGNWLGESANAPASTYLWNADVRRWEPAVRFGYRYTPWQFATSSGPCDSFDAKRSATDVSIATPAGSFSGVRKVAFMQKPSPTVLCAPNRVKEIAFASGVGPVAVVSGMGELFLLQSAKVGGRQYPASGVSASLSSDRTAYVSQRQTVYCITAPCPPVETAAVARFSFTVANHSGTSRTFRFTSGQQFEIELLDSSGKVVRAWSDGRAFTMALTSLTLAPGQRKSFTGEVELKDRQGALLKGTFTARARLTAYEGGTPTATSMLTVSIQET
ncbi:MAG: hypothetical protein HYZ28_05845 [Myxococcales bacterium]|nr:hypothetical protein [Myxococcales bacterium]